jgi:predicted ATPase
MPRTEQKKISRKGISKITVSGYKSIKNEISIDIKQLTILAGANSSGKSSILQPLLLLKQTLEQAYDPGPLNLNGPHVTFTQLDQIFSRLKKNQYTKEIQIGFENEEKEYLQIIYGRNKDNKIFISSMTTKSHSQKKQTLTPEMTTEQIIQQSPPLIQKFYQDQLKKQNKIRSELKVLRQRCFLVPTIEYYKENSTGPAIYSFSPAQEIGRMEIDDNISQIIHVPGLRGNPERFYALYSVGPGFPGSFERYTATVIHHWQSTKQMKILDALNNDLESLGLTWKVSANAMNDTQVELYVGRLPHAKTGGARDLVSVADVGFGVSQTLPLLVALHVAKPGQIVYVEQPEIHLHPRAQANLADIIVTAANRGVKTVIETHSNTLLLALRTAIVKEKISSENVILHWFTRDENGWTKIQSSTPSAEGGFDCPDEFGEIELKQENEYLDAIDKH